MTSCHLLIPAFLVTTTRNGGFLGKEKQCLGTTASVKYGKKKKRSAPKIIKNIFPSSFTCVQLRNIWSFHGVVLQENAMTQNARAAGYYIVQLIKPFVW